MYEKEVFRQNQEIVQGHYKPEDKRVFCKFGQEVTTMQDLKEKLDSSTKAFKELPMIISKTAGRIKII